MDLLNLDDLIPFLGIDPSFEHLEELYSVFKKDFIDEQYIIDRVPIRIDTKPSLEEGYEDYPHTFVKIITRGKKGHRVFDRKRANKIHWIKEVLNKEKSDDILVFDYLEANRKIRRYFWFKEGDFLVILQRIGLNYIIVSCFHVDDYSNRKFYEERYNKRVKK